MYSEIFRGPGDFHVMQATHAEKPAFFACVAVTLCH
jgi:hypothetical protein